MREYLRKGGVFFKSQKQKNLFLFPKASKANGHLNIRGNVAAVQRLDVFSFCIMPGKTESSALLFSAVACARTARSGHCLHCCLVFYDKLKGLYRLFKERGGINIMHLARKDV